MTFAPIDTTAADLFDKLPEVEAQNLGALARQRRLAALCRLGHTQYQVEVYVDAHAPYLFLFTRPPTLSDVAGLMAEFNMLAHIVSIRVQTAKFARLRVPNFCLDPENTGVNRPFVREAAE